MPSSGPGSPLSALMICALNATPCIGLPSRLPPAIPPTWVPWEPSLPSEPTDADPSYRKASPALTGMYGSVYSRMPCVTRVITLFSPENSGCGAYTGWSKIPSFTPLPV
ncbi:hypothetical protein D3C80_1774710 [compost metagenome]